MTWHDMACPRFNSIRFGLTTLQQRQRPQGQQAPGGAAPSPRPRAPPPCRPTAAVATSPAHSRSVQSACCRGLPTRCHAALPCGVNGYGDGSVNRSTCVQSEVSDFHGRWASLGTQPTDATPTPTASAERPHVDPTSIDARSMGQYNDDAGSWGSGRLTPGWAGCRNGLRSVAASTVLRSRGRLKSDGGGWICV